ncbi:MAG: universal stress protein [Acidimicrobiales bacterium]
MHIIVGVDDSPTGLTALRWALRIAGRAGATVEAVRSWAYQPLPMQPLASIEEMDHATAQGLAATVAAIAAETDGDVEITTTVVRGPARHALLALVEERHPSLVVVGRRSGHERTAPRALGSVSRRLVDAASCPVAVVSHDPGDEAVAPVIMVALDGSAHAERALRWATDLAQRTGGSLVLTQVVGMLGGAEEMAEVTVEADAMLAEAAKAPSELGIGVTTAVGFGDPRRELERVAEEHAVDLIVIGPRGLGGIAKLVTGSVATHLADHAEPGVIVVPSGTDRAAG